MLLSGSVEEIDHDVVGVPVEVAAGPVIPGRHPGVAVPCGDLDIAQRDTCVKAEVMTQAFLSKCGLMCFVMGAFLARRTTTRVW